jgi:hypothetical protein
VRIRTILLSALLVGSTTVLAQQPPSVPSPGRAPRGGQPGGRGDQPAGRGDQPASRGDQPTPASAARTPATPAPASPRREGQAVNVKVEFTLTDQRGGAAAAKRTVTVVVADGRNGFIRSSADVVGVAGGVVLNIDVGPELLADGKIRLGCNLQYDWPPPLEQVDRSLPRGTVMKTVMHDSVSLILESGKPMVAAQSADPIGDRQVTVEVKATVLR